MRNGNKKIFHLEAWVVKVMSLYKVDQVFLAGVNSFTDYHPLQHFFYDIDMSEFD